MRTILHNWTATAWLLYSSFSIIADQAQAQRSSDRSLIETMGIDQNSPMQVPPEYADGENICRPKNSLKKPESAKTFWEVFPLRDRVSLYAKPEGGTVVDQVGIGDFFVVYKEDKESLLLGSGDGWGEAVRGLKFRGWGKKSDFLLHRMAIKQKGIYRKAMVVNYVPEEDRPTLNEEDFKIASYYASPECTGPKRGSIAVFRFLYVYETFPACSENPTAVLAGETYRLDERQDLLGWIPKDRITLWDTREALEINFDHQAFNRRKSQSLPVNIFEDLPTAEMYAGPKEKHRSNVLRLSRVSDEDFSQQSWPAEVLRYPILKKYDMNSLKFEATDDIYEIGFIGNTLKVGGTEKLVQGEISKDQAAALQQSLEQMFQDYTEIDILFVVDATASMGPYLKATGSAIKNAMRSIIGQHGGTWKIHFAGAIYRDYEDNEELFAHLDLTSDQEKVNTFFKTTDPKSADTNYPEAVFYGLKNAVSATRFREKSMRFVILIGDAGNHSPDPKGFGTNSVSPTLFRTRCHFLCLRVAPNSNSGLEAGAALETQSKDLIRDIAKSARQEMLQKIPSDQPQLAAYFPEPQLQQLPNGDIMIGQAALPGAYMVAQDSVATQRAIERFFLNAVKTHGAYREATRLLAQGESLDEAVRQLRQISGGASKSSSGPFSRSDVVGEGISGMSYSQDWLRELFRRVPNVEHLLSRRVTMYKRAFVNLYCKDLPEPLFKPVVLLTGVDLGALINLFKELIDTPNTERLSEGWRRTLDTQSGETNVYKSVSEYAEQQLGLPVNSDLLKTSLTDIDGLGSNRISMMIQEIRKKNGALEKIFYDDSPDKKRWFLMNAIKYYWVRVEELP